MQCLKAESLRLFARLKSHLSKRKHQNAGNLAICLNMTQ